LKVGILASKVSWHVQSLLNALGQRGVEAHSFPITRFVAHIGGKPIVKCHGIGLDDYRALLVRIIPWGSLEQIIFRMDVLHHLEDMGIRIVNSPSTIEKTVDKYYTSAILESQGIPTPRTVVTERFDEAMAAFQEMGVLIVKPLFGANGRGMVRVSDEDVAYRTFRALELGRYLYYLQEYIPHANQDIRAFVVGGQVVAAMLRQGRNWKTNLTRGGWGEALVLDEETEELAVRAAQVFRADYLGVDILRSLDGRSYVVEVNSIPGWEGLQKTTEEDIAGAIVDHVLKTL